MGLLFDLGVEKALRAALEAHDDQTRKGSSIPYISHPMHVAMMLSRMGCDAGMVQAGLLHDVVEDCDDWTTERVRAEFGSDVAELVEELTEESGDSWEARKQAAVDKVATMTDRAATLKACDKLHNLSTLAIALEESSDPETVWSHFSRGPESTIEKSLGLVDALSHRIDPALSDELSMALARLKRLASI
ncbi:MAG: bifunctional (p)ppGpp synthetase/guanosine-3',5'-bis(diphosphate) 3'-pyrophosphohydrolase [Planctomycetes bacterium]|nr:bifunctional (p)ppGpp synthetase/guanosine-3',5'-bis(diphosphate) 3'-pyrophosphohydrolase [Planctomycetota bacterium]